MCILDIGLPLFYKAFLALSTVSTVQSFNVTLATALLHCGTRAPSSITANMDTWTLFHFTLLEKLPIFNTVCVLCRHVGHSAVATHARHVAQGPGQHQTCAGHVTRVRVGQQLSRDWSRLCSAPLLKPFINFCTMFAAGFSAQTFCW